MHRLEAAIRDGWALFSPLGWVAFVAALLAASAAAQVAVHVAAG